MSQLDPQAFDPQAYGAACAELLQGQPLCELGPGQPNEAVRPKLEALDRQSAFAGRPIADRDMAACCIAGLWLLHNFLEESHRISQSIHTPTGSYWHGIMHRREPDFSNAKYWFRRVGDHPVFSPLCEAARQLASACNTDAAAEYLARQASWDPLRFVDLCEAVTRGRSASGELCRRVAQAEWRLLFDYGYQQALK